MITFTTVQQVLAESFFDNNMVVAGMMMYVLVLIIGFAITRNIMAVMLISLPITLIFSTMGIITGDILIVLIIVSVVGLAIAAGRTISGRD